MTIEISPESSKAAIVSIQPYFSESLGGVSIPRETGPAGELPWMN